MSLPWGTKNLTRLGKALRDGVEPPSGCPPYADVMSWFNDLATSVQERVRGEDWTRLLGHHRFEMASRPKTIDTLREKLQRDHNTPLPNIQDIAGVRFEAEMTLRTQDAVARRIATIFDQDPDDARVVHDMRDRPHSGYRAVHVWLRLPDGRVEVQVRTALQGAWANVYERAGDLLGREIRYGTLPEDPSERELVKGLIGLSQDSIRFLEETEADQSGLEPAMREAVSLAHNRTLDLLVDMSARLDEMNGQEV